MIIACEGVTDAYLVIYLYHLISSHNVIHNVTHNYTGQLWRSQLLLHSKAKLVMTHIMELIAQKTNVPIMKQAQ